VSKIIKSKSKPSRRFGFALWGRDKDAYHKKNYAPGQHGPNKNRVISAYGKRLNAARALRTYYDIRTEKQFRNYFEQARKIRGNTIENFIGILESRLSMIVYRLRIVDSIFAARQLVGHGHITVNGKHVDRPGFLVSVDDVIGIAAKSKDLTIIKDALNTSQRTVPSYLVFDQDKKEGTLKRKPVISEVPYPFTPAINSIIEYYSR
jgi:small subunit ribosomal protein S4